MNRERWPDAQNAVRTMIESGELRPGDLTPAASTLSALTGTHKRTCRKALLIMVGEGELAPPLSPRGRPRVPGGDSPDPDDLALAAALAAARKAARLTQAQLAERAGLSAAAVHYAETGLLRCPASEDWARLDQAATADGKLIRAYAEWRAAL